jgi:glycosyltransferase involved in cell wall biosynthesis
MAASLISNVGETVGSNQDIVFSFSTAARVSIIVPTQNEVGNIEPLVTRLLASSIEFQEIVFVDNRSIDGTSAAIKEQGRRSNIRMIHQSPEAPGLGAAIIIGARAASGDILVVMDADLSHPPEAIRNLVQPLVAGVADLAIGSRYIAGGRIEGWPLWRRILSRAGSLMAYPLTDVTDSLSGFFAIRRHSFLRWSPPTSGFKILFDTIVRARSEFQICEVPFVFRDRVCGKSKMSMQVALRFFVRWILGIFAVVRSPSSRARLDPATWALFVRSQAIDFVRRLPRNSRKDLVATVSEVASPRPLKVRRGALA